jgi:sensor domain CHASE-containing protein
LYFVYGVDSFTVLRSHILTDDKSFINNNIISYTFGTTQIKFVILITEKTVTVLWKES